MRYFFLISGIFLVGILVCLRTIPVYDLSVERSNPILNKDGIYYAQSQNLKNIWYIGIKDLDVSDDSFCVVWSFDNDKKTECIDHDGTQDNEIFTFPVLSSAVNRVSFQILNHPIIDPANIVLYSMDTRAVGSQMVFQFPGATAENGIISRKEWGADESIRYADSPQWKNKYAASLDYLGRPKTQIELDTIKILNERSKFLRDTGGNDTKTMSLTRTENGHTLVWPIEKVKQISRIVLHHTAESMDSTKSDEEMIRGIYAYHTLTREWGDIAYNYIVGQRGKVYEGRAGGDYVVGAHAVYNNMGTVGISVLGNYNRNHLNLDQITGIERTISMVASKYGITLSASKKGVIKCDTSDCYPFQVVITKGLIEHQDVGRTDCPGSGIHQYIPEFISRLDRTYTPVLNPILGVIEPPQQDQVMNMALKKTIILPAMAPPVLKITPPRVVRYIGPKFRVKLSYPNVPEIILATADGKSGQLFVDKRKIVMRVSQKVQIGIIGDTKLSLKVGEKYFIGSTIKLAHTVVRIDSWDHFPDWDKIRKYNDNLFRDTIRVVNQNGKLVVINDLPIEWYLKGLGEVSNTDLVEKIKVITVAARSYARYYMDPKNRKFATNLYDGSDDPDEFQKYLGYSYELRSPNVAKLVDATRNQVITYSGKLIKAWYHSSSDGRTLSALEYCQRNGAKNCVDIPYLQSEADPAGVGNSRLGHGVGISGIGATYWASIGWNYKKIIQYYLKGVEIQRK